MPEIPVMDFPQCISQQDLQALYIITSVLPWCSVFNLKNVQNMGYNTAHSVLLFPVKNYLKQLHQWAISTQGLSRWLLSSKIKVCLPIVWVGLTELGLFSWGRLSEFRVARGLAIGAVDLSFVSPVQRRVNWSVGPWENVSNGGNLWRVGEIKRNSKK